MRRFARVRDTAIAFSLSFCRQVVVALTKWLESAKKIPKKTYVVHDREHGRKIIREFILIALEKKKIDDGRGEKILNFWILLYFTKNKRVRANFMN